MSLVQSALQLVGSTVVLNVNRLFVVGLPSKLVEDFNTTLGYGTYLVFGSASWCFFLRIVTKKKKPHDNKSSKCNPG